MKIVTVSLSRTIPTGPYENVKVGMEATIEPGESEFDALNKLSQLISDWNAKQYRPIPEPMPNFATEIKYSTPTNGNAPPTIDYKQRESLEIQIDNATTLEQLAEIKDQCWKSDLKTEYIAKFNLLNNVQLG